MVQFESGWCDDMDYLVKFNVSKNNKCYSNFQNDFILGKTNQNNQVFDVLSVARRDIKIAQIPSFIKVISESSFGFCNRLFKIVFLNNSSLQLIEKRHSFVLQLKIFLFHLTLQKFVKKHFVNVCVFNILIYH